MRHKVEARNQKTEVSGAVENRVAVAEPIISEQGGENGQTGGERESDGQADGQVVGQSDGEADGIVDSLGRHVPEDLAPLWHRRQEVQDVLTAVSRVRSTIRQAQEGQDPLWAEANFSSLMAQLDRVYAEVDATKPYVVCPMCQGIGCRVCKERGLLGKYRYDTVIPRELKIAPRGRRE